MSALARQRGAMIEVTDGSLDALLSWVTSASTPVEEVAWSASEFQGIRDWLTAHKAAQDLRKKAVRAELIALRRVAASGLASKLTGTAQTKPVALWLAGLADDGFAQLLDDLSGEETPIGIWRKAKREGETLESWLAREEELSGRPPHLPTWNQRYRGVSAAASELLTDLQIEGTSFTIQEAADRLAVALEQDGIEVHQALRGTPLTQLVRNAIHRATDGHETFVDRHGRAGRIPTFVTYESHDGVTRVPTTIASLGQLRAFVSLQQEKARQIAARADEYSVLLDALDDTGDTPDETPVSELLADARRARRVKRPALAEGGDAA